MSSTAYLEAPNGNPGLSMKAFNGLEECVQEGDENMAQYAPTNERDTAGPRMEIRRVAQSVEPMRMDGYVPHVEDEDFDDFGNVLEALPTPRNGSPSRGMDEQHESDSNEVNCTANHSMDSSGAEPSITLSGIPSVPSSVPFSTPQSASSMAGVNGTGQHPAAALAEPFAEAYSDDALNTHTKPASFSQLRGSTPPLNAPASQNTSLNNPISSARNSINVPNSRRASSVFSTSVGNRNSMISIAGTPGASSASNRNSYYDFSALPPIDLGNDDKAAPRLKTIEQYLKAARKSNDLQLEFQLAQYMMQTALSRNAKAGTETPHSTDSSKTSESLSNRSEHSGSVSSGGASSGGASSGNSGTNNSVPSSSASYLFKESLNILKRLSERGYSDAQYLLGDIYASPAMGKPDMEKSLRFFLMAAKHGHAEAAYRSALCLQEGWGTQRDGKRALQFYKSAAVRNQPGALYKLGIAYFYGGMGLPDTSANRQAGVKWLSRAANVSDKIYNRAPHALAKIFEVGYKDLVIPDGAYAARLYARSAELGYVPSAARLGKAYEIGELGCPQDASLSIHYFTIAALGNDPSAQLAMCAWYMVGAGPDFPVNRDEAYEWALRAALNGLPKAQYTIGFFLENGIGHHRDVVEASKWYHRAAANGYSKAKEKLGKDQDKKGKCAIM